MDDIFLIILYIIVLIVQIICLIKAIKSDRNRSWLCLCGFEIVAIVCVVAILFYYNNLPALGFMPGLTYLGEVLTCFAAIIVYFIMLFVTICAKIIVYERAQKSQGNVKASPIGLIVAVVFVAMGVIFLTQEILENQGMQVTIGVVSGFKEEEVVYFQNGNRNVIREMRPIIKYLVDGNEYEDMGYADNVEVGDKVKIHYIQDGDMSEAYRIIYPTNNKYFYIPLFVIGFVMIVFRFRRKN